LVDLLADIRLTLKGSRLALVQKKAAASVGEGRLRLGKVFGPIACEGHL